MRELGDQPASDADLAVLGQWTSWGAIPQVFEPDASGAWRSIRDELEGLLDDRAMNAASRTTINAHYTDPRLVEPIWQALHDLCVPADARVLEPGCGTGLFIAAAPDDTRMVGVELDPTTAAIAAKLNPSADIHAESFADSRDLSAFDAVVGNVPFSEVVLHDPVYNRGRLAMHNHFIAKSLHMTAPGGMVAVLTSRWTMDATNTAAREQLAELGELITAVRLPAGAHRELAGTDAITDLLILRRHDTPHPDQTQSANNRPRPTWIDTAPLPLPHTQPGSDQPAVHDHPVNQWWHDHPHLVLGEPASRLGQYGPELTIRSTDSTAALGARLSATLTAETTTARHTGRGWQVHDRPATAVARTPGNPNRAVGHLEAGPAGTVRALGPDGSWVEVGQKLTTDQRMEVRALIDLRDHYLTVITAEASDAADTPALTQARAALRDAVEKYHSTYGPISRYTTYPTGKPGPDGTRTMARRLPAAAALFRTDPFAVYVQALEEFNDTTQQATPAAITEQRVLAPRAPRDRADSPADAIALSLEATGTLDRPTLAALLDIDPHEVDQTLGDLAYTDPDTGDLVDAGAYLSGPVRAKLAAAEASVADRPELLRNVTALRQALPPDLLPGQIKAQLGATWIPAEIVEDFARDTLRDRTTVTWDPARGWSVKGGAQSSVAATQTWGTPAMSAHQILRHALDQTPPRVYDQIDKDTRVLNPVETEAAREKLGQLRDRFAEWAWADPIRGDLLAREYNDRFNSVVVRTTYDHGQMTFPGLARSRFDPRPHQRNAVARIIAEGSAGIFHPVGYGKTATMAMALMEQRRLGLVRKPAMIVPNHMLEQASREFLQLYPAAKILAASSDDLAGEKRRGFVARASTGDWDAVIMTRTAFERLPVNTDTQRDYMDRTVTPLRDWLTQNRDSNDGDANARASVKRVEKAILAMEERLKARLDQRVDDGITFEQTGIDYLAVDELHDYKNLMTASSIEGAAITGSQRATNLDMKLFALRARHGNRAILGATATPISNSITEMHVMLRYLDPEGLQRAGVVEFDQWASTFGEQVTRVELAPDGAGYREKTRFARFGNVPEMMTMWRAAGDAVERDPSTVAVPDQRRRDSDGERQPEIIEIPASSELIQLVQNLSERAARLGSIDPAEDNMLKITSEGRAAAMDLRLLPETDPASDAPTKAEIAAVRIAGIWKRTHQRRYLDPLTQTEHPTPGALQLVFADLGTPKADRWNIYDALKTELITRGVPAEKIAFIHNAATTQAKARLFERARTGEVHVLIGSTERMGVGTNVQARAIALHHLDCTWKPAQMEQREGRIIRNGNQNPEIGIFRYATKNSFDAYMYGTVARKAAFIDQVVNGSLDQREVDDIASDSTLSYEEMQAAIADNPHLVEKHQLDQEIARLQRLERGHNRAQQALGRRVIDLEHQIRVIDAKIPRLVETAAQIQPTAGDAFRLHRPDSTVITKRTAVVDVLHSYLDRGYIGQVQPLGRLGGLQLEATITRAGLTITAASTPTAVAVQITRDELADNSIGPITRLENAIAKVPAAVDQARDQAQVARDQLSQAQTEQSKPFPHTDDLDQHRTRQAELAHAIAELARDTPADQSPATTEERPDSDQQKRHRAGFPRTPAPTAPEAPPQGRTGPAAYDRPSISRER